MSDQCEEFLSVVTYWSLSNRVFSRELYSFNRCPCFQLCYLSVKDIDHQTFTLCHFYLMPCFSCMYFCSMIRLSAISSDCTYLHFWHLVSSCNIYPGGVHGVWYISERYLHFRSYLQFQNCVDLNLTRQFRSVIDDCVLAVDLGYPFILCAFYHVIVCVISSSKAGWHYQTSANLSVAMKWSHMLLDL